MRRWRVGHLSKPKENEVEQNMKCLWEGGASTITLTARKTTGERLLNEKNEEPGQKKKGKGGSDLKHSSKPFFFGDGGERREREGI